ncbi:MbtH family protein [Streptomyces naphthomycinicus]|uniref:MbtH family protein n=1 Tax=Streptomyces naphthomycinicus TaxID=2872625 RepID=UPI001CEC15D0|nr:MbtH family NRPS accessory protein [Streptomyces sp. TML10]
MSVDREGAGTDPAPRTWNVLINAEEQYGLFPADREPPGGWRHTGFTGDERSCERYVDEHWTDMRPLSLRRATGPH